MRPLSSLTMNISHGIMAGANLVVGLLFIHKPHMHGVPNLVVAAGIGVLNLYWRRSRRRLQIQMQVIEETLAELRAGTTQQSTEAYERAVTNLRKVAKTIGANVPVNGHEATIRIDGSWFHIAERHICRTGRAGGVEHTCLNFGRGFMPIPEQIASTLLLLKHDPKIFKRWKKQDRFYA